MFYILGAVLWVMLAFWPAWWAKKKGYSFILFLLLSWFVSFVITLIAVAFLKDKTLTPGDKAASAAADRALEDEYRANS